MKIYKKKIKHSTGYYSLFLGKNILLKLASEQLPNPSIEPMLASIKPLMASAPLIVIISQENILELYKSSIEIFVKTVSDSGGSIVHQPLIKLYNIGQGENSKT